ncbi:MAG: peptidoglycan-associated lipoprotein Pal [Syntrophales bacterium]
MKRILAMLMLAMSLIIVSACSHKSIVREDRAAPKGEAALEQMAEVRQAPAGGVEQTTAGKDGAGDKAAAGMEAIAKTAAEKAAVAEKADLAKAAAEKAAVVEKTDLAKAAVEKAAYELTDINFDFDNFDLGDEAREVLKKHAAWLTENKGVNITVEGHCDERGTAEYNLALGERRAKAAAMFLVNMGIDDKRIKTISYGEELPLDPGHDEAAWARNRRAHFVASGKQ